MLLASVLPAAAQGFPWGKAQDIGPAVTVHAEGRLAKESVLEVQGTEKASTVTMLIVDKPPVPSHHYQLRGRIKYDNVDGVAFVEMWSRFPDGGQFFTRTLADAGPMSKITGSSPWRDLALPFFSKPGILPDKLWVNLVLPGKGKIYLTPLELAGLDDDAQTNRPAWWTEPQAGLAGGIAGGCLGTLGALIGILAGLGLARRFTLAACWTCISLGGTMLLAGLAALFFGQPYHVYFPLLLAGGIAAAVCGFNLPALYRRYRQIEMRRMSAMDA